MGDKVAHQIGGLTAVVATIIYIGAGSVRHADWAWCAHARLLHPTLAHSFDVHIFIALSSLYQVLDAEHGALDHRPCLHRQALARTACGEASALSALRGVVC